MAALYAQCQLESRLKTCCRGLTWTGTPNGGSLQDRLVTMALVQKPMPQRPGHKCRRIGIGDAFMLDFENSLVSEWIDDPPRGPRRFKVDAWAALVKRNVYPHHSDVDWDEYCDWVRIGGGDEWFQEE